VSGYAQEERELEERDYRDEVDAAYRSRSFDRLHDLQISASALVEALQRRSFAEHVDLRAARAAEAEARDDTNRRNDRREKGRL
jgi:hypothetical protein